ncbi:unnamed protein product [Closterium sp. Naga37s-1]|nr:unnamed protein product [Closterium sp. Naga37s-1]
MRQQANAPSLAFLLTPFSIFLYHLFCPVGALSHPHPLAHSLLLSLLTPLVRLAILLPLSPALKGALAGVTRGSPVAAATAGSRQASTQQVLPTPSSPVLSSSLQRRTGGRHEGNGSSSTNPSTGSTPSTTPLRGADGSGSEWTGNGRAAMAGAHESRPS